MARETRTFQLFPGGGPDIKLVGRTGWALEQLMEAGSEGVTPSHNPAPRWSEYVRQLRRRGFDIETIRETHEGPYPGTHGRYVLRSRVVKVPPDGGA